MNEQGFDQGFSKRVMALPSVKPVVLFTATQINEDEWRVYEDDKVLLVNLKEFQAKSIAAILNVQ